MNESLLTSFSKVFEKALYIRLNEHINNYNILIGQQFGFRKRLAMEDAIFKLTHENLNAFMKFLRYVSDKNQNKLGPLISVPFQLSYPRSCNRNTVVKALTTQFFIAPWSIVL